jgi:hypothetical protein
VIRVRLFHGRQLVRNKAARVHSHHARFTLRLGKNAKAGRYMIRLSVDSAGQVAAITHNVRVS